MRNLVKNRGHLWLTLAMMAAYCCVVTCISSFLFALILGHCDWTQSLLLFIGGLFCCAGGYCCRQIAQQGKKAAISLLIGIMVVILACIFMYFLFYWNHTSVIAAVCALLFLIMGWIVQKTSFSKLSSSLMIMVCLGIHLAVYFFSYLITRLMEHLIVYQFPFQTYIFLIFPIILILLLFRNQTNSDELMKYGKKHISKTASSSRMSITFTIAVVIFIVFLYFLRTPILWVLSFIGSYLKYGLSLFLQWFFQLVSSDENPEWINDPIQQPPTQGPEMKVWMTILGWLLIAAVTIGLLYLLIRCFPSIRELWKKLLKSIKQKVFRKPSIKKAANEYFYDNITDIDRNSYEELLPNHFKRWGSFTRAYRKAKDPVRQIRLCYGYILELLKKTSAPPLESDTPLEIAYKVSKRKGVNQKVDLSEITSIYSDVRYAEVLPTQQDSGEMFEQVKMISKKLKNK